MHICIHHTLNGVEYKGSGELPEMVSMVWTWSRSNASDNCRRVRLVCRSARAPSGQHSPNQGLRPILKSRSNNKWKWKKKKEWHLVTLVLHWNNICFNVCTQNVKDCSIIVILQSRMKTNGQNDRVASHGTPLHSLESLDGALNAEFIMMLHCKLQHQILCNTNSEIKMYLKKYELKSKFNKNYAYK